MERVDIPASGYYKANDGTTFSQEAECLLYEQYCDKYLNAYKHAQIEDANGRLINFFYLNNQVEAHEVSFLYRYKYGHNILIPANLFEDGPGWFCAGSEWYDYEDSPVFTSLDMYMRDIEETISNYQEELTACINLKHCTI